MKYETNEFLYELVSNGLFRILIQVIDLDTEEQRTECVDCVTAAHYRPFTEVTFADFCDAILDA